VSKIQLYGKIAKKTADTLTTTTIRAFAPLFRSPAVTQQQQQEQQQQQQPFYGLCLGLPE